MEALDYVQNQDFVEFSKAIKKELYDKVNSNPYVLAKKEELNKFSRSGNLYKEISNNREE